MCSMSNNVEQLLSIEDRLLTEILKPTINSLSKIERYVSCQQSSCQQHQGQHSRVDPNKALRHGNDAIHHAAKMGRKRVLEILIKTGCGDPTRTNHTGQTALMIAARGTKRGHSSCVKFLLSLDGNNGNGDGNGDGNGCCDVNAIDHIGRTALRQAILSANLKSVELLLENGSDLSWDEHNNHMVHGRGRQEDKSVHIALAFAMSVSLKHEKVMSRPNILIRKFFSSNNKIMSLLQAKLETEDDTSSYK